MLPYNNGNRQRRKTNSNKNAKPYKPKIEYTDDGFPVTTLYVKSLGKEIRRENLVKYFSTFGNVQNVRIHTKATRSFGFVTFGRAESAAKALARKVHIINNREINIAVADSWHQEKPLELSNNNNNRDLAARSKKVAKIPIELTNATGTNLLDLNDDCLYEIFSMKHFNLMDLCSVAESCSRLKDIAIRIFTALHKSCKLNEMSLETIHEIRRVLINFGSSITELTVGPSYDFEQYFDGMSARVMDLVIRYCSKTLESLKLQDYEITEFLIGKLKPMFSKLQKLHIEAGYFHGDTKSLFSNCASLVELKVIELENDDIGMIFENRFPKLEHFKYAKEYDDYDNYNLELFVSRHQTLKAFIMKGFGDDCSSLLPVIADNCKNLEKLQITGHGDGSPFEYEKALQSLLTLTKLTKLKIKCDEANATKFIQDLPQLPHLEFLELWHVQSDAGFIPALSELKNLNVLRLRHCKDLKNINSLANLENLTELSIVVRKSSTDEIELDVISMLKRLVNLKKLTIGLDAFKIDKKMYLKIVNVVRERTGRSPSSLEVITYKIEDDVADMQLDGKNQDIVKLDTVSLYGSDDGSEWSDTDYDYSDYDDDDDDDDSQFDLPAAAFLMPFLNQRLFQNLIGNIGNSDSDEDESEDEDEEDAHEVEDEVW